MLYHFSYREAETKQAIELAGRKLQMDLKSKDQQIHQLESEVHELQVTLGTERESRALQVQNYLFIIMIVYFICYYFSVAVLENKEDIYYCLCN